MNAPERITEAFLKPGEVHFGDRNTRIRTVLGSCVALTVWHPRLQIGGMCHYMLPARSAAATGRELDGTYADEAIGLLLREMRAAGTQPGEYETKLFGGGNMFPAIGKARHGATISCGNIDAGRALAQRQGLRLAAAHTGGSGHRSIIFELWSGAVWLKHQGAAAAGTCGACERNEPCSAA